MEEVMIDGQRFVKANSFGPIQIIIFDRGYIFVGRPEIGEKETTIHDARCIIRWGTTKHLAELCNGPLTNTKLGDSQTVLVPNEKIIFRIEVNQDAWE